MHSTYIHVHRVQDWKSMVANAYYKDVANVLSVIVPVLGGLLLLFSLRDQIWFCHLRRRLSMFSFDVVDLVDVPLVSLQLAFSFAFPLPVSIPVAFPRPVPVGSAALVRGGWPDWLWHDHRVRPIARDLANQITDKVVGKVTYTNHSTEALLPTAVEPPKAFDNHEEREERIPQHTYGTALSPPGKTSGWYLTYLLTTSPMDDMFSPRVRTYIYLFVGL